MSIRKEDLFEVKQLPLVTNVDGFDSKGSFSIHKSTGEHLGNVGDRFVPIQPQLIWDALVQSVEDCDVDLDLDKTKFIEFYGGAKIQFKTPIRDVRVKTKFGLDVTEMYVNVGTGFDGKTSLYGSLYSNRPWCANGCYHWKESVLLRSRNTYQGLSKLGTFCQGLTELQTNTNNFEEILQSFADKQYDKKILDKFMVKLVGCNAKEYAEQGRQKQRSFDDLMECIAIESKQVGDNLFGLFQGLTRFTNHYKGANKGEEYLAFASGKTLNMKAEEHLRELVGA